MKLLEQFLLDHPQLIQPSLGQDLRTTFFAVLALISLWMFFRLGTVDLAPEEAPVPKWAFNCWKVWILSGFIVMGSCALDSWSGKPNQPDMSAPFIGFIALVGLLCFLVGTAKILKVTVAHTRVQKSESET